VDDNNRKIRCVGHNMGLLRTCFAPSKVFIDGIGVG
jgi:hypothetical protein